MNGLKRIKLNMKMAKVSASLIFALLAHGIVAFSAAAQSVVNVSPKPNAEVAPNAPITGTLKGTDNISIPVESVKIFLDGKDVTSNSGIDSTAFSYQPQTPLKAGTHTARVEFTGSDGVGRFVTWTFTVNETEAIALESITHNATNGLASGSVFQATLRGSSNQTGSVLLIRSDAGGQTFQELPAREVSPGEYIASFTIGSAPLNEGIVLGRLQGGNDDVVYAVANTPARFNLASQQGTQTDPATQVQSDPSTQTDTPVTRVPLQPQFTSHKDGDLITSRGGFVLKGQTRPGAVVTVKVNSVPRNNIGGILGSIVSGTALVDQSVNADSEGNFEVAVPRPLLVQKGTKYRVEAIAATKNQARTSPPITMELIQD